MNIITNIIFYLESSALNDNYFLGAVKKLAYAFLHTYPSILSNRHFKCNPKRQLYDILEIVIALLSVIIFGKHPLDDLLPLILTYPLILLDSIAPLVNK
jgi:hypothetical protein